jgi:dihydrofolate synthase/folylpolyglutamate synthase
MAKSPPLALGMRLPGPTPHGVPGLSLLELRALAPNAIAMPRPTTRSDAVDFEMRERNHHARFDMERSDLVTGYADALARLLSSPTRPKLGLDRMRTLLDRLGHPERRMGRVLHVAGTKGKGSTSAFAEAICREAGLRTGLTTSPHLCSARERIAIDGAMIDEATFASLESQVHVAAGDLDCSFFERMIAMAFVHFASSQVDVAVVEVGLGGELDATNVVSPSACAITKLGLDHTEWLGPTLTDIARAKAGILKPGVPAVSALQPGEARAILEGRVRFIEPDHSLHPSLAGIHQVENATLALAVVRTAGIEIDDDTAREAIAHTVWPGRYETVSNDPLVVVDGAHNEDSARALANTVASDARFADGLTLVVGMTQGHDTAGFARALARMPIRAVVPVSFASARAKSANEIAAAFATLPRAETWPVGPTLVTGSLYLVGEVRHRLLGIPLDPQFPLF